MSKIIQPSRRGFITGLTSLIVAPAIVRVENLMPVKVFKINSYLTTEEFNKEVIKLFVNSNSFIQEINSNYDKEVIKLFVNSKDEFKAIKIPNSEIYNVKAN